MPELREEASQFVYVDGEPVFMVKQNGVMKWFRIVPASVDDLKEIFNAKKV